MLAAVMYVTRRIDWHATGLRHRRDEPTKVTNCRTTLLHDR